LAGPAERPQLSESLVHKPTVIDPEPLLVKETRIPRPVLNDTVGRPESPLTRTSFRLLSPILIT